MVNLEFCNGEKVIFAVLSPTTMSLYQSFCAQQHYVLLRAYATAIPSVCLCVTQVIHAKTVVARIVQFSPYSSPIPLVFAR